MRSLFTFLGLLLFHITMAQSPPVSISTKNGSTYEEGVMKRVQDLLKEYDLSKWIFTDKVIVEDNVIPHSHPVLTLNTKKQSNDDLLSTFIHEQVHWHCEEKDDAVNEAMKDFKKFYPEVPVGRPDGARDTFSTYLHLVVCYLEYDGLTSLVGKERATKVMEDMNHYKWIYRQVLDHNDRIGKIVKKHGLYL